MYGKGGTTNEKIIVIPRELYDRMQISPPSRWFIIDAMGNRVYFKVRSRESATEMCDKEYGKGHYTIGAEY